MFCFIISSLLGLVWYIIIQEKNCTEVKGWVWKIENCLEVCAPPAVGKSPEAVAMHFTLSHPGEEDLKYILTPRHPEWKKLKNKRPSDELWLNTTKNKEIILVTPVQ